MRRGRLLLALTVLLSSCAFFQRAAPPLQEDLSIRFPSFHEPLAGDGGAGQPLDVEGVTLRALTVAANDFLPLKAGERPCWEKQEAHRYRVLRQGDIVFVFIFLDPAACGHSVLDGGVKYAIHVDGRILRRLFDGEPEALAADSGTAGEPSSEGTLVPSSQVGSTPAAPASGLPASWFDGGVPGTGMAQTDGGVRTPDAG